MVFRILFNKNMIRVIKIDVTSVKFYLAKSLSKLIDILILYKKKTRDKNQNL